jgi:hypothetical protein
MLWFKTFYEAVGLPKLNGVAINGDFASLCASFSSRQRISTRLIMWSSGSDCVGRWHDFWHALRNRSTPGAPEKSRHHWHIQIIR